MSEARASDAMTQTKGSFRDKWEKNPGLAFEETLREGSDIFRWILLRNGFGDAGDLERHLRGRRRLLDAGCGNGRITALLQRHTDPDETEIVGIDLVAAKVAERNLGGLPNVRLLERDLLGDLSDLGRFDFIYCQEVLHHTGDPRRAFGKLCRLLEPGGEIAIYVYKKKAPPREFVDEYVRSRISGLSYDQALVTCRQLTDLGRALSQQGGIVEIPAVDVLEIPAGTYHVQRFLYHFFVKCFWNPDLSYEDNVATNFDWYHPSDASKHTLEEVRTWFEGEHLRIEHEHVDEYGITMRGRRPRG